MKFRIVQLGNGKYQVQKKEGIFDLWRKVITDHSDYKITYNSLIEWCNSSEHEDFCHSYFSDIELARAKLKKEIEQISQALNPQDIEIEEKPIRSYFLIKRPRKNKKQKSYRAYYKWWLSKQSVSIWISYDASMPFKRENLTYILSRKEPKE